MSKSGGLDPRSSDGQLDEVELRSFVSSTLSAIVRGIAIAAKETRPQRAGIVIDEEGRIPLTHQIEFGIPDDVAFDIAVTVSRKSQKSGGLKIEVMSVGANATRGTGNEASVASRICFKVPVNWKNKQP